MSIAVANPEIKAAFEAMLIKDPLCKTQIMESELPPGCIWFEIERAFALGYIMGCKKHGEEMSLFIGFPREKDK